MEQSQSMIRESLCSLAHDARRVVKLHGDDAYVMDTLLTALCLRHLALAKSEADRLARYADEVLDQASQVIRAAMPGEAAWRRHNVR